MSLRLISFLILLGTMPICSVYAQCEGHSYDENGFCTCGSLECTSYQAATYNEAEDYYEIANAGNLYWFAKTVNSYENATYANAILKADIVVQHVFNEYGNLYNANFRVWTPIGYDDDVSDDYHGTFDGQGYTISGLYCYGGVGDVYIGLFGVIGQDGTVKNLGIKDSYFNGTYSDRYIGGIAGLNNEGTVTNCYVTDSELVGSSVGGIVGLNNHEGTVTNCYVTDSELAGSSVGGIVGVNEETITNCYSTVYGIAGKGDDVNKVENCYYLEGTANNNGGGVSKSSEEFASGEVAYLLNGNQENLIWGQNIDNGQEIEYYPVHRNDNNNDNNTVYQVKETCESEPDYSNYNTVITKHVFNNGFCVCGAYQEPQKVSEVYQIANAGNLYWFAALVNGDKTIIGEDVLQNSSANAKLMNDIVVNKNVLVNGTLNTDATTVSKFLSWTPIGTDTKYGGIFDGNNKTISGLYENKTNDPFDYYDYLGLFGEIGSIYEYDDNNQPQVASIGTVKNLGIKDSYFCVNSSADDNESHYVGAIAGHVYGGKVIDCYNEAQVHSFAYCGGIVGYINAGGEVSNCYNVGNCSGKHVGGIAGNFRAAELSNCYYLEDTATTTDQNSSPNSYGTSKSSQEFSSGEVAYLLQSAQNSQDPIVWGQNIDNDASVQNRQYYPVLGGAKVYQVETTCSSDEKAYSNTNSSVDHAYVNGICACGAYEPATYSDNDNYYEIANAGNLYWFAKHVNDGNTSANAKLINNITVNEHVLVDGELNTDAATVNKFLSWTPMGYYNSIEDNSIEDNLPYSGTFDGNNKTISGLYYNNNNTANSVGLFGYVYKGSVQNVGVIDSYFKAKNNVGAIVGYIVGNNNSIATVSNCYNTGVCQGNKYVAGLVGHCSGTTITNCYNTGSVRGDDECGGIVGAFKSKEITNCFNYGNITVPNGERKGAIAAYTTNGTASNCYYLNNTANKGIGNEDDAVGKTASKTSAQFASGEVAYLLQGEQNTQVWGQNIDNGQEKQDYPVFSDARVYRAGVDSYSNGCGDNVYWLYENGVLTIEGTGDMKVYTEDTDKPWSSYLSNINTVVVKAGITGIGANAFSDITNTTTFFFYNSTAITIGEGSIKTGSTVYVPDLWNVDNVAGVSVTKMPTYTGTWSKSPDANSHVVINSALVLGQQSTSSKTTDNNNVLTVSSFGLTENGSITIKADELIEDNDNIVPGGQLICQQANGEVTVQKSITGDASTPGWYTISSPLKESVYATSVTNLIDATANNYALYRYDEPNFTWENYKHQANNFTTLDAGRGYLYANAANKTLSFEGDINTKPVEYKLTANGSTLSGIHLVGNPFTHDIKFSNLSSTTTLASGYYILDGNGGWGAQLGIDENVNVITPGQGILIKTTAAGTLTINPTEPADETEGDKSRANSQQPMLSLNVSNGNYSDRAFVIFGEGVGLDKINHQNEEIPMLYIPMSDADYAIAMMDESVNEIPVGFESSSMGQFTITLKQENCEFEELYLLDKETGAKVNILEEGYTFMATSGDNAERFVLLKDNGQQTADNSSNFAYVNNNDIVIYNIKGNVQVDIYDVMGRRVYNANGSDDVHIVNTEGYSAGVYVIRIMDENGLRTQKVVIE